MHKTVHVDMCVHVCAHTCMYSCIYKYVCLCVSIKKLSQRIWNTGRQETDCSAHPHL